MKILGIVMEANPFHNGHKLFIETCKKEINPDLIVAITSTSFTMRGEISLLNKFDKTKILLNNGVDIVLELPIAQSLHSANNFSKHSILNLSAIGITDIAFGSESTDLNLLNKFVDLLNQDDVNNFFGVNKDYSISTKNSYKEILKKYISDEEINIFNKANVTLGVQYLKTIKDYKLNIIPHIIKRVNSNYHDKFISSNIASATAIRQAIINDIKINDTLPPESYNDLIDYKEASKKYIDIIKYKYLLNNNDNIFLNDEGINNYIVNNGVFDSIESLQDSLKNKRYTINRINRQLLYTILDIKSLPKYSPYLRILGINNLGLKYLNSLNKEQKGLIFSGTKEIKKQNSTIQEINELEIKSTKLYSILTNNKNLVLNEAKLPIILVERK